MNLNIVGGTYREFCNEGEWKQLFGSGLRAAAAIQNEASIHLHTYVSATDLQLLAVVSSTFKIILETTATPHTIVFTYDHGLSVPHIFPPLHTLDPSPPIHLKADKILRFGMVEGDAIVDGEMVVYDPQSAHLPRLFRTNGSNAKRLVIVCNRREAMLLTNERDVLAAAKKLLSLENAEAVVVKCGSHGALLLSTGGQQQIPAFRTSRVWPIGSGDVFAATFFACWCKGMTHSDAAIIASKATAHYCDSKSLPLPLLPNDLQNYSPLSLRKLESGDKRPRVYLAGPFFNMEQRWLVHQSREALIDQGLDVFSPFHDVGIGVASEVAPADIDGLVQADVVFALLDQLDSGTIFEVGYARAIGKPVIGFCQNTSEESLKMLAGTDCDIVDDFVSAIYHTAWTALQQ